MKKSLSLKKALEKSQVSHQLSFDLDFEIILNPVMSKKEREYLHLQCGTHASKSTKKYRRLK